LQADAQTTVAMLCLTGLHVLDKNNKNKIKKHWQNKKKFKKT